MKIDPSVAELQREKYRFGTGMHRPHVPQRLCAQAHQREGNCGVLSRFLGHRFVSTKSAAGKSECLVRDPESGMHKNARHRCPFPSAFNGKHHPAGRKPSSNELEIVPRYNRFLQLLEDVIVAATFEAFAVVGVDVDRAIVVDVDLCVGFSHDAR
jgi:hypothetical protein